MKLRGFRGTAEPIEWDISDEGALDAALQTRDNRGGNYFSLFQEGRHYPCLLIRVDHERADVGYLPYDGHPGFRCESMVEGLDPNGYTRLVFTRCDPGYGEDIPNRFVVSFAMASLAARDFLAAGERSPRVEWFEL